MSFFDPYSMDYDDNHDDDSNDLESCSESVDEVPPFALVDSMGALKDDKNQTSLSSAVTTTKQDILQLEKSPLSPTQSQQTEKTAAMGSSILYSPTVSSSQNDNFLPDTSRNDSFMDDIEFDAAASLLAESPSMELDRNSYFLQQSEHQRITDRLDSYSGATYSQLMRDASDKDHHQPTAHNKPQLPTLPENQYNLSQMTTSAACGQESSSSILTSRTNNRSLIGILDAPTTNSSSIGSHTKNHNQSFLKRGIESVRVDAETFETSLHIYASDCTVHDVMDIVGNPDMLRLWCEPVRTLVVTRSSEGARSAAVRQRNESNRRNREYDGEWIEATTSTLIDPIQHTSTVYLIGQFLWNNLGFPSYGKLTMFVERVRGKIGLTMGPFAGDLSAFHSISVVQDGSGGFIKVVDRVRIAKDENHHHHDGDDHRVMCCCCCCGLLCDAVHRCFMPQQLKGHMDQSEASMARLRVMIENGQDAAFSLSPPDLIVEGEEEHQHGVSTEPLLLAS